MSFHKGYMLDRYLSYSENLQFAKSKAFNSIILKMRDYFPFPMINDHYSCNKNHQFQQQIWKLLKSY